jgi:hypothetical protein
MSNSKTSVIAQLDRLNDVATLTAVCCLAIDTLETNRSESTKDGLHCLLTQIESTIVEAVQIISQNCK